MKPRSLFAAIALRLSSLSSQKASVILVLLIAFWAAVVTSPVYAQFTQFTGGLSAQIAWRSTVGSYEFEGFEGYAVNSPISSLPALGLTFAPLSDGTQPGIYRHFANDTPSGPLQIANFPGNCCISSTYQYGDLVAFVTGPRLFSFAFWNGDQQGDAALRVYDVDNNLLGTVSAPRNTGSGSDGFAGFISSVPVARLEFEGSAGDGFNHYDDFHASFVDPVRSGHRTNFDFDGDGRSDVLWKHSTTGQTVVWLMNGTSIASTGSPGTVSDLNFQVQAIGDFDGDGKADVLWKHAATGQAVVWLMNAGSIANSGSPGAMPDLNWVVQGVGDFNGDGKSDVLWKNAATGQTAIWFMNGTSIANSGSSTTLADLDWQVQGVGDLDGDGKADIVWRHATSGVVQVWLMDGTAIASSASPATIDSTWQINGVGDFDGDGKADIVWRNTSNGAVLVWLMSGAAIASNGSPATLDSTWQIRRVGDFDGDGKADLLWRNTVSGNVIVWLMNGSAIGTTASPGTVSDLNWVVQPPSAAPTEATIPGAPTAILAIAGNAHVTVSFTPPASTGGSAITSYTVTSSPGGIMASGAASPIAMSGLTNGTTYTFTVTATNAVGTGPASAPSNSVTPAPVITAPGAPTAAAAIAGNAQATVSFAPPANNGGSAIVSYSAISSPGGVTASGSASPIVVSGLTNGTAYTFTVTAANAVGNSTASAPSNLVTPATVPGAPAAPLATAGNALVTVSFAFPASNGGSAITGYTVTSTPGDITVSGATSPIVVSGLTNGIAYTFTVTATNSVGMGQSSAASNAVTPNAITVPSAPTAVNAVAGNAQATVSFAPPASNGGSAIVSYSVISSPGGIAAFDGASPIVVSGLTNGIAYTFTVTALNSVGAGPSSAASNLVTPNVLPVPTITAQPSNQTVTAGQSATFTVAASGIPAPTIQWQVSTDGGTSWNILANDSNYSGVVTTTLTVIVTTIAQNQYRYRAVASNTAGSTPSSGAVLTVNAASLGTVVAWGGNANGQTSVPLSLNGVTAIAAGPVHTVALKSDGTVVAWGDNRAGQTNVPAGLSGVMAIAAGGYATVALRRDGTVVVWGGNDSGQTNVPIGLSGVTAIAAGESHVVALKSDGTVRAWGWNPYGQATVPAGLSGVMAIAAGEYHTVAVKSDGTVAAWGAGTTDLGIALESGVEHGQSIVPAGLSGVTAIAAGGYSSMALKSDGTVVTWGDNYLGQINVPAGLNGVTAIAAGGSHVVALKSDGTVVAWGYNDWGQTIVPSGLSNVTAIAAGNYHTVALIGRGEDFQAPSVPTGLTATAASSSQNNLSWTGSTDNVGVTQYKVYRGGTLLTTLSGTPPATGYSDTGLLGSTAYSYTVAACDAAGNCSAQSLPAVVSNAVTTTSVVSSMNPLRYRQSVTFTATVGGGLSPTGTVQFTDGAGDLGDPVTVSGGQAHLALSTLSIGTHAIGAAYSGDASNGASGATPVSQVVRSAVQADLNGDGRSELFWRNASTGQTVLWPMNGASVGVAGSPGTVSDLAWHVEGIGDFDGDGNADVLWQNRSSGQVVMWLMNGMTIASAGSTNTVSDLNWVVQGVGDFDGDGKADVLWKNISTGQTVTWLMNGLSIASSGSPGTVSDLAWVMQGVGDFDGNGKADLLWKNTSTGQTVIWLMNGLNVANSGSPGTVSDLAWAVQGVGDFDGNGKADLLWKNATTGQTVIWLMNGLGISSAGSPGTVSDLHWQVQAVGDYDGDGKADVFWQHRDASSAGTGQTVMWLMNGMTINTSSSPSTVSDLNWKTQPPAVAASGENFSLGVTTTIGGVVVIDGRLISVAPAGPVYTRGTVVTITETPTSGLVFAGWLGACSGLVTTCQVTMNSNLSVTATFNTVPVNITLTTGTSGTGQGTVGANPTGPTYASGTVVTLTATPNAGSTFAGWSGACSGLVTSCQITMNSNQSVTAAFNVATYTLTLSTNGTGSGTLTPNPVGGNCGAGCYSYLPGTVVTVTSAPASGSVLTTWGGACAAFGSAPFCQITLDANLVANGTFGSASSGGGTITGCPSIYDGTYIGQFFYGPETYDVKVNGNIVSSTTVPAGAINVSVTLECDFVQNDVGGAFVALFVTHAVVSHPKFECQGGCTPDVVSQAILPSNPPTTPFNQSMPSEGISIFFPNGTALFNSSLYANNVYVSTDGRTLSNTLVYPWPGSTWQGISWAVDPQPHPPGTTSTGFLKTGWVLNKSGL